MQVDIISIDDKSKFLKPIERKKQVTYKELDDILSGVIIGIILGAIIVTIIVCCFLSEKKIRREQRGDIITNYCLMEC